LPEVNFFSPEHFSSDSGKMKRTSYPYLMFIADKHYFFPEQFSSDNGKMKGTSYPYLMFIAESS